MDLSLLDRIELFNRRVVSDVYGVPKSIAVVGNGPLSEQEAQLASSWSLRVRMNDWSHRLQNDRQHMRVPCEVLWNNTSSHWNTYGVKATRPKIVVFQHNQEFGQNRQDFMLTVMEKYYKETERFCVVSPYLIRVFSDSVGRPNPTCGLSAAWWIDRAFPEVPKLLCGFNWEAGRADRRHNNHNWEEERAWFQKLMTRNLWVASDECAKALWAPGPKLEP